MQLKAFGFASREPQTAICRELELISRSRTGQRSGRPLFLPLILSLHQLMHRRPRLQRRPGGNGQESPVRRGPPTSIGFTLLLPQKVGAAFQVDMKKCSASKRDTSHIQTLAVWRPVDLRHAAPSLHNQIRCGPTCSGQNLMLPSRGSAPGTAKREPSGERLQVL